MAETASTPEIAPTPVVDNTHCWDPILDSGGVIPVCIPLDAKAQPYRVIMATREDQMFVHFKCCLCSARATRRFKIQRNHEDHGAHHHVFDLPESDPLPDGPCSGAQT